MAKREIFLVGQRREILRYDRSHQLFLAQITSCAMRYDVICHPLPINSQYLKTSGVDSTEHAKCEVTRLRTN